MKQGFHVFLANLMHIFLYKERDCPFVLGDIEKITKKIRRRDTVSLHEAELSLSVPSDVRGSKP